MAKRVKYVADEELEKMPADGAPSRVNIKMKDGTIHKKRVDYARGTIQNPMTKAELGDKFRGLASMALSDERVENIIQTVDVLQFIR